MNYSLLCIAFQINFFGEIKTYAVFTDLLTNDKRNISEKDT